MNQQTGKYIIVAGLIIVVIGIVVFFFHNAFRWIGRLPGDIDYKGKNTRIYFPWVTMLLASIILTLLINLFRK